MKKYFLFSILLLSSLVATADVEIPIPDELINRPELTVNGTPGINQSETFSLCRIKDYTIALICDGAYPLNKVNHVAAGLYYINYSESYYQVNLSTQKSVVVNLQKIKIPKNDGSTTFTVFSDLTNQAAQDIRLRIILGFDNVQFCKMAANSDFTMAKDFCKLINTNHIEQIRYWAKQYSYIQGAKIRGGFYTNGDMLPYAYAEVTNGKDPGFVSVLPGVYGVHFVNNVGDEKEVLNIEIK